MRRVTRAVLLLSIVLAACAPKPWEWDPDVQAAKDACESLPEGDRYTCIERHAVEALNPNLCRLTNKWIDDMCLQAVYQAADDPAICARLYLKAYVPPAAASTSARLSTSSPTPRSA